MASPSRSGYHVSKDGFRPPKPKTQAILEFPKPEDSTQFRRFIGMLKFYHPCIPNATLVQSPLTEMLKGVTKKKVKLVWTDQANEVLALCKKTIASAPTSAFISTLQSLAFHTDTSLTAIGSALDEKRSDGVWIPLGFLSRKLLDTEQRYSM